MVKCYNCNSKVEMDNHGRYICRKCKLIVNDYKNDPNNEWGQIPRNSYRRAVNCE